MNPNPHRHVNGTRSWPQRTDAFGVRYDAREAFDEIAANYSANCSVHPHLQALEPSTPTSRANEVPVTPAFDRALLTWDAVRCVGAEHEIDAPAKVIDWGTGVGAERGYISTPVANCEEGLEPTWPLNDAGGVVRRASVADVLLSDVPLIVEDLLMQARQLADTGATIEVVEKILNHVAALREGGG